jgi:hypothetical protein
MYTCDIHLKLVYMFGSGGEADRIFTNAHTWRADLSSCIPMMGNKTILPPNWKLYHVILSSSCLAFFNTVLALAHLVLGCGCIGAATMVALHL